METVHLRATTLTLPSIAPSFDGKACDAYASHLLAEYGSETDIVPLTVTSDGNCFFNAVSVALFGTEDLAPHLRLRCAIYYILHTDSLSDSQYMEYLLAPSLDEDINAICHDGGYSSFRAFVAAADILNCPIDSVYLPVNGTNDKVCEMLNKTVLPSATSAQSSLSSDHKVRILWSRTYPPASGVWVPNHFVPLVACTCFANPHQQSVQEELLHSHSDFDTSVDNCSGSRLNSGKQTASDDTCVTSRLSDISEVGMAENELRGPLKPSCFLDMEELLRLLAMDVHGLKEVPDGVKENVYFVVNNADNVTRRAESSRSVFRDDCGVWTSAGTGTPPSYFILSDSGKPSYIRYVKGVFGKLVKGSLTPLTPHPQPDRVIVLRRSYSKLKRDEGYRRRVTWVDNLTNQWSKPLAVIEYSGTYPQSSACHGNSAKDTEYVRTKPSVIAAVDTNLKSRKRPHDVYSEVTADNPEKGPRNMQQVYNRKKKIKDQSASQPKRNLADDVQTVLSKVQEQKFVRSAVVAGNKPPTVIVYTDQQLADVKRFCTGRQKRCILGIDRTFNLGKCFVTVTTFKYVDVLRNKTNEPPVFLGPCYLHWDGTVATYANFFHHLRLHLTDDVEAGISIPVSMLIGSDDE